MRTVIKAAHLSLSSLDREWSGQAGSPGRGDVHVDSMSMTQSTFFSHFVDKFKRLQEMVGSSSVEDFKEFHSKPPINRQAMRIATGIESLSTSVSHSCRGDTRTDFMEDSKM